MAATIDRNQALDPGEDLQSVIVSVAHLFGDAGGATAPPRSRPGGDMLTAASAVELAKRLKPFALPKLRPRSVRTLPPPSVLPPKTYPRVELPREPEASHPSLDDTMTLGTEMFPPRPRWRLPLAGAAAVAGACLVALLVLSTTATSRVRPPLPLAASAPVAAAGVHTSGDVPASAAAPAPAVSVSGPPCVPPAEPRRALPHPANGPRSSASVAPPLPPTTQRSSHRLFDVQE